MLGEKINMEDQLKVLNYCSWFTFTQFLLNLRTFVVKSALSRLRALGGTFQPKFGGRRHQNILQDRDPDNPDNPENPDNNSNVLHCFSLYFIGTHWHSLVWCYTFFIGFHWDSLVFSGISWFSLVFDSFCQFCWFLLVLLVFVGFNSFLLIFIGFVFVFIGFH